MINFILSLLSLKNIGYGDICWVQRVFSQFFRCWCAGALSSMLNADQDQIAPLWVSILKVIFFIFSMDHELILWIWLTIDEGMW